MSDGNQIVVLFVHGPTSFGGDSVVVLRTIQHLGPKFHPIVAVPPSCEAWDRFQSLSQDRPLDVVPLDLGVVSHLENQASGGHLHAAAQAGLLVRAFFSLARVVIRQRVDVVYTMDRSRAVIVATLVARLLRRSLVWHGHCPWHPWGLAVRAADRVAVITDFVRDEYERHGIPRHRVQVIHNGIDAEYYASSGDAGAARRRLDLGPDTPLVLMPGRLSRYKGQLELVEAMPAIAQSSPESRFVFAGGDSGELGDIRATGHPSMLAVLTARLEELGLSDRAIFTRPTDQEMADLYAAADVVVVPSWEEPFGLVVIEGMAAGAAVVGSASGGIPESIVHGESGLLVPPRDPLALGEAIRTLLGDSELRSRLGKAGQARVRALFSIERYVGDMERLLASAARPSLRSTVPYAAGSPGEA